MGENSEPESKPISYNRYLFSDRFYKRELQNTFRNPDLSLLPTPAERDWYTGKPK